MGSFVHTLVFFIITLGVLITFHEFGHFWVARKVGVKVIRFSIGFGTPFWRYQKDPNSTEFVAAAIPLGGYVKMVDEREGEVKEEDLPYAFNRQSLSARSAIVLAGPVFNLMLAILIYWGISVSGETGSRPVLGPIEAGTFAAEAGLQQNDEIIQVAGRETPTWNLAMTRLMSEILDTDRVEFKVRSTDGVISTRLLDVPGASGRKPDELYKQLGLSAWQPHLEAIINQIEPGSPAAQAGLQKADKIIQASDQNINSWQQWVEIIRSHPDVDLSLLIERNGDEISLQLHPESIESDGQPVGRIGAGVEIPEGLFDHMRVEYKLGIIEGFTTAVRKTFDHSWLTLKMLGRMLIGKVSVDNLSGPISIAKYAGQAADIGLLPFLNFLAIVSISLGVLNLLPIPVLDGGHLLFFMAEALKGSPVSMQAQLLGQQVGMAILLCLMGLAFFLDIERFFT